MPSDLAKSRHSLGCNPFLQQQTTGYMDSFSRERKKRANKRPLKNQNTGHWILLSLRPGLEGLLKLLHKACPRKSSSERLARENLAYLLDPATPRLLPG